MSHFLLLQYIYLASGYCQPIVIIFGTSGNLKREDIQLAI